MGGGEDFVLPIRRYLPDSGQKESWNGFELFGEGEYRNGVHLILSVYCVHL